MRIKLSIMFLIALLFAAVTASASQMIISNQKINHEIQVNALKSSTELTMGIQLENNSNKLLAIKTKPKDAADSKIKSKKKKKTKKNTPKKTPKKKPQPAAKKNIHFFLSPSTKNIQHPSEFTLNLSTSIQSGVLAAYGIVIDFNSQVLDMNTNIGQFGVEPGRDGFMTAANYLNHELLISGFNVKGVNSGEYPEFLKLHFKTKKSGDANINIRVDSISDSRTAALSYSVSSGAVSVK